MNKLFTPNSVALIGATEREGSVGRTILENLMKFPDRKLYPVNPNRKDVLGLECFPSVSDIPVPVDLAVIVTPARTVPAAVEECGKAGIGGVIIISAGFREAGEDGRGLEDEIRRIRYKYGMRIVGPNCLGVIRPHINLNASFLKVDPKPGKIAFISQSGALGSAILDWAIESNVGFSMFASLGSMIDVDFGDLIDFLGDDPNTRSIMLYIEGVGHAKKFMSAARGFARNKPIIVIKPGKFAESAKAAVSHTGALAGDYHVYDAAFKRAGVIRIEEIADLFNVAEVLESKYLPKGPKLAIVTNAGGVGVITVWMGGKRAKEGRAVFLQNNIPTYETPEHAVKTYLYMYKYGRNLQLLYETPAELPVDQAPPKHHFKALIT